MISFISCKTNQSIIKKHVDIELFTYDFEGKTKVSAMPILRNESTLNQFSGRFEYLLINVSAIHLPENFEKRNVIWSLYPDTIKLKKLYLYEYIQDEKLNNYFEKTNAAINDKKFNTEIIFTSKELMEVASKFFYCDKVFPDTTIQSHICIGLNGVSEANWSKDYRLLEAFCFEGIFNDLNKEVSQIDDSYSSQKEDACIKYKSSIQSLDQYLVDVRMELFARMKEDVVLKQSLLEYYELNKNNLAFKISD